MRKGGDKGTGEGRQTSRVGCHSRRVRQCFCSYQSQQGKSNDTKKMSKIIQNKTKQNKNTNSKLVIVHVELLNRGPSSDLGGETNWEKREAN